MEYRIYASDVHGREKGHIKTVNGHDVVYADRKESLFHSIDEDLLQSIAASEEGLKCVLIPVPDTCTGKRYSNIVMGVDRCTHPDTITTGIRCHKINYNKAAIEFPFANIDGVSDQCFKLVAVPAVVPFYNEEGVDELVLLLMPQGAFLFADPACTRHEHQLEDDEFSFPGPLTENEADQGPVGMLFMFDDFGDEDELRERAYNMYNRYYGYPDVLPEHITITASSNDPDMWIATLPEDMKPMFTDKSVSDIHAWIRGVHFLKEAIDNPTEDNVTKVQEAFAYRCVEYLEEGPTEEEMHPPQPEEVPEVEASPAE